MGTTAPLTANTISSTSKCRKSLLLHHGRSNNDLHQTCHVRVVALCLRRLFFCFCWLLTCFTAASASVCPSHTVNRLVSPRYTLKRLLSCIKAPESFHITPILRSLHWLRINECIEYKLLSCTVLTTSQPDYLHSLISVQSTCKTRSSSAVILARPSTIFVITNHQLIFWICITLPVESAPFFIPSTSFCSLSSWFTSSCTYHLITVITFVLTIYHSVVFNSFLSRILNSVVFLSGLPSRILNLYWTNWTLAFVTLF